MADNSDKPACKYGDRCYQRNEAHKSRFWHPSKDDDIEEAEERNAATKRDTSRSPELEPKNKRTRSSDSSIEEIESSDEDPSSATETVECPDSESTDETSISNEPKADESKRNESKTIESSADGSKTDKPNAEMSNIDKPKTEASKPEKAIENISSAHLEIIRTKLLIEMPKDALRFWDFCKRHCSEFKRAPECLFEKLGLKLVGPFDVLAGHFDECDAFQPNEYLRHWRFYFDPPEFQTVLVKTGSGIHYGIWRDEPTSAETFIARNDSNKSCEVTIIADNMFSAVLYHLEKEVQQTMFNQREITTLKRHLNAYANEHGISLNTLHTKLKARNSRSVCKTFHRAGLVVPFDRKTEVGYRQVIETDVNLKKMLQKFPDAKGDKELLAAARDKLEPLITAANIACDESDFGNTIELGLDLFCFGAPELHSAAQRLLQTGYSMVGKSQFATILKAHLENRQKSHGNLSILTTSK